jgi:hypothetical protein
VQVVSADTFSPVLGGLMEEANLGVQLAACTLLLGIGTRAGTLGERQAAAGIRMYWPLD